MQTHDAPAEFIFKLWPWLEANKNRLIGAVVAIILIAGVYYFISAQHEQKEIAAGQAVTGVLARQATLSGAELASSLQKVADTYAGTAAAQRAQLQAAASLFTAGNYADSLAQFSKYLQSDSTGPLAATAQLGVASCQEALNKPDLAATAYQRVISAFPGSTVLPQAQFGLGRIAEQQGKIEEAVSFYDKVTASAMGGTLAQEAALRASTLKLKLAAMPKAAAAAAPAMKPDASKPAAAAPTVTKP